MATPGKGEWITVTRRRRPKTLQTQTPPPPATATTITPYLSKPSYAQILQVPSPRKPSQKNMTPTQTSPVSSKVSTRTFQLPDSPTKLRYPLSPHFQEWWGRCFCCARKGHVASACTNPARCLNCTKDGHTTKDCKMMHSDLNPAAKPFIPTSPTGTTAPLAPSKGREATFHELLAEKEPAEPPIMLANRPTELTCYFNRDWECFVSAERLDRGIVILPTKTQEDAPSLDSIAELVASSKLVSTAEVQVGLLSNDRILVLLPEGTDRDTVIRVIPRTAWDKGFSFQSYSPMFDASIDIPFFKLWIDLEGVPIELWRESDIAKAVSGFGLYLGSIEPALQGDFRTWFVFVATSDLKEVPLTLKFKVGGMFFTAKVIPRKWIHSAIYKATDIPPLPLKYSPPPAVTCPTISDSEDISDMIAIKRPRWYEEDDIIPMSLTTLKSIFQGVNLSDIPSNLAACLAGDRNAIQASKQAYREWEARDHLAEKRRPIMSQPVPHKTIRTTEVAPIRPQVACSSSATENPSKTDHMFVDR